MKEYPVIVVIGGGFGGIELIGFRNRIITQPFLKEKCMECEM